MSELGARRRSPLPALFMRFVIQSVTNAPQLRAFVCGILAELVNKAVWSTKQQWTGWVKCVQDLVPDSLPVLLQVWILAAGLQPHLRALCVNDVSRVRLRPVAWVLRSHRGLFG